MDFVERESGMVDGMEGGGRSRRRRSDEEDGRFGVRDGSGSCLQVPSTEVSNEDKAWHGF